ncbi:MAG TPA: hypothetical protein EYP14_01395, partial [Planctomycetaceae bacterium]|nr:hypothetical protein [Planctomycetaceae bacterium]
MAAVDVEFNERIDLTTFEFTDIELSLNGVPIQLDNRVSVTLLAGTVYRISGLSPFTGQEGQYTLAVKGSDPVEGTVIVDLDGNPAVGSASTTWTMDPTSPQVIEVVEVEPDPRNTPVSYIDVIFSEEIDLTTFTWEDLELLRDGEPVTLDDTVAISWISGTTYRISNLSGFTGLAGSYELRVYGTGVTDPATNVGTGIATDTWVMDLTGPQVTDVIDVTPDPRNMPVAAVEVVMSELIDIDTFTFEDITLTRDGSDVPLGPAVAVSHVSGTTYRIEGLTNFTDVEGDYVLTVEAGQIQDIAGNFGTNSGSDAWTMDLTAPQVV